MTRGRQVPVIEPGSPEWQRLMSASKISAVLGLCPQYDSAYALWHRMSGLTAPTPDTDRMRRGHYLEAGIADWFQDQYPDWDIEPGGTWVHGEHDWMIASPDRIVRTGSGPVLLELKTDAGGYGWGEEGTDQIPSYYATQVQWQMDVVGASLAYVAVVTSYFDFKQYMVRANPAMQEALREAARDFLDSIRDRVPPPLDDTDHTYRTVKELHPDIDGTDIDLGDLGAAYVAAKRDFEASKAALTATTSLVADAMGNARNAFWNGQKIARRQNGKGGPHLTSVNGLLEKYPAA